MQIWALVLVLWSSGVSSVTIGLQHCSAGGSIQKNIQKNHWRSTHVNPNLGMAKSPDILWHPYWKFLPFFFWNARQLPPAFRRLSKALEGTRRTWRSGLRVMTCGDGRWKYLGKMVDVDLPSEPRTLKFEGPKMKTRLFGGIPKMSPVLKVNSLPKLMTWPEKKWTSAPKPIGEGISDNIYLDATIHTLWWTNIAIENGHRNSGFSHTNMVIFHCYVSSPEGNDTDTQGIFSSRGCPGRWARILFMAIADPAHFGRFCSTHPRQGTGQT